MGIDTPRYAALQNWCDRPRDRRAALRRDLAGAIGADPDNGLHGAASPERAGRESLASPRKPSSPR